ncbi:MAG: hypothetical protein HY914_20770 [Desulfomonile tiedjei]|nr:hypothetical protein [Desulfomonile tiedjei]
MNLPSPIGLSENREIDGFDLLEVLGLMKEYNRQEIWRRYLPAESATESISMYVSADPYFVETHIQRMQRIILTEKFNTNPFFMQQVVQRIMALHDHALIMEKIRQQGIDTGENPISLSCSLGDTIIDLIIHRNDPPGGSPERPRGTSFIEQAENRPLDVYDLSSTLYLSKQDETEAIFQRYQGQGRLADPSARPEVNISCIVGDYSVHLHVHYIPTDEEICVPPPGNASALTMHQVIERMNFRHSAELILKEMQKVGLSVTLEQVETGFTLQRYVNNTALRVDFKRM